MEPAAARVEELLATRPLMSWINLGEVFYVTDREAGRAAATEVIDFLEPRLDLDLPSRDRVLDAATLKSEHRIAYADAFAIATAIAHDAVLVTGDPEILSGDPAWPIEDVRGQARDE
jgi:predicted nucleic acid-binding protein